jgi:hypothetical protein
MFRAKIWCLLAGALSLCLLARAEESTPTARQIAAPKRIPDVAPGITPEITATAGAPVNTASMPHAVRSAVVADAARRFQVAEDAVVLASAELVTWSDGSLGCPQPGRSYTQNLVPGYRVTATTAAGRLLYHTDTRGNVMTCGLPVRPKGVEPRAQPPAKDTPDR